MAWMIDGNKLKEKAVSLLFPTKMESCGHLPEPVQAVTVSTIEDMVYREGIEVVRCKDCEFALSHPDNAEKLVCSKGINWRGVEPNHYCSYGERKDNDG